MQSNKPANKFVTNRSHPSGRSVHPDTSHIHIGYYTGQHCGQGYHDQTQAEIRPWNMNSNKYFTFSAKVMFLKPYCHKTKKWDVTYLVKQLCYLPIRGIEAAARGVKSASTRSRKKKATKTLIPVEILCSHLIMIKHQHYS